MKGEREVRLPETDQELREFLDHATVGLRWVGPDGRILWANRAELDLVGYPESEYVGRHIAEFLVEPETAADLLGRLAREERVLSYETRLRTRDGSIKRVLIDGSGLFRDGQFVHGRLATRDITGLMEKEQAARHRAEATSHLKDEFLALLSHELRAPLGAILVWLGLLRQGGFDPAERERALDIIERSARSLERIIEDLLHASRIAAGGLMLHPQLVDVRGVVQVAVDAAAGDAARQGPVPHLGARRGPDLGEGGPRPAAAGRVQPPVERHQVHPGRRPRQGLPGHRRPTGPAPRDRQRRGDEPRVPALRLRAVPAAGQHEHPRPPRPGAGSLCGTPRHRRTTVVS